MADNQEAIQKPSPQGLEIAQDTMMKLMANFECDVEKAECGAKCCSNILLVTQKEIDRIRNYIKRNHIIPTNRHNVFQQTYIDKCPFLDDNTLKCKIYSVRPCICQNYSCNQYRDKPPIPNYRKMRVVNMLTTFSPEAYCPPVPDLDKLEAEFKRKKKMIYG